MSYLVWDLETTIKIVNKIGPCGACDNSHYPKCGGI